MLQCIQNFIALMGDKIMSQKKRIILMSDIHYNCADYFGRSPEVAAELLCADLAKLALRPVFLRHTFTKLPMNERLCAGHGPYSFSAAMCCAVP